MKTQSLFYDLIKGSFRPFVGVVTEKNKEEQNALLHKLLLSQERSVDMTFETTGISSSVVAADIVALESPLPLKSRPSFDVFKGEVPKIGAKYRKGEREIARIRALDALTPAEKKSEIKAKLLDDVPRCIKGVDHRIEIMFLQALSTGVTLIEGGETDGALNEGVGVRVTFGGEENTKNVSTGWDDTNATTISDLRGMFDRAEANGNSIEVLYLTTKAFDQIRASKEGKELVKSFLGQTGTTLPTPSRANMEDALKDEFKVEVVIVKSSFKVTNHEGKTVSIRPFDDQFVVGTPAGKLGRLVYGELVEEYAPVAGVIYEKSGNYTLVSKYSANEPVFGEWTAGQALAIPVIDVANEIYRIKTVVG